MLDTEDNLRSTRVPGKPRRHHHHRDPRRPRCPSTCGPTMHDSPDGFPAISPSVSFQARLRSREPSDWCRFPCRPSEISSPFHFYETGHIVRWPATVLTVYSVVSVTFPCPDCHVLRLILGTESEARTLCLSVSTRLFVWTAGWKGERALVSRRGSAHQMGLPAASSIASVGCEHARWQGWFECGRRAPGLPMCLASLTPSRPSLGR